MARARTRVRRVISSRSRSARGRIDLRRADCLRNMRSNYSDAQSVHRFDGGCAAGGNVAGDDGCGEEKDGDSEECGEVDRLHAVECALHGSADEVGSDEADGEADAGENHAFPDDEGDDAAAVCAERHAEGDLVRALRDREGHDAVDTEAARRSATAAKLTKRTRVKRSLERTSSRTSSMERGWARAISGSTVWTAAAMLLTIVAGSLTVRTPSACGGPGDLPEGDLHLGAESEGRG